MYKKTIIAAALILFSLSTAFGQRESRFVTVGDTNINLADVDLEKGLVIRKVESRQTKTDESMQYEKKVFTNFDKQYYMIVQDSSFYSGFAGVYKTSFAYYKEDGTKLFSKHFNRLDVSRVFILKEGNKVIVELGSEDQIKFILYDDKGNVLKEINNKEVHILSDSEFKTIYIQPDGHEDELQIINSDKNQIDILRFPDRVWLRNFSPDGEFFTARCRDSLMVFNRYGDFQWGLKYEKQNIYIFSNGRKYYVKYPFPIGKMEVKEAVNHTILFKIDGVYFKGKKYPVYKSGVVNNSDIIWVSNYVSQLQVFNFIDENGQIINDYAIPSKIATRDISFKNENGKYVAVLN